MQHEEIEVESDLEDVDIEAEGPDQSPEIQHWTPDGYGPRRDLSFKEIKDSVEDMKSLKFEINQLTKFSSLCSNFLEMEHFQEFLKKGHPGTSWRSAWPP
ncbi:hypothetical protein Pint_26079 [Pistacia integerrima]|uniref:Uncharacterized protein n=1 Tax=Pistacia integerrima TaxID=434235 RepID=A0ACC0YGR7_9ROSI|nr:hypothetical protein Pint_26079 [Pistacia integerrima]